MVTDQHTKITGYRDLPQADIDMMNQIKGVEADVAALVQRVVEHVVAATGQGTERTRQAALARSEFEGAFMRLNRAVANPISPWVR